MTPQEAIHLAFEKWTERADASGCPVVATLDASYAPLLAEAIRDAAAVVEVRSGPLGFAVRIQPRVVN